MASNLIIEEAVNVPVLLEDPNAALFPVLRHLMGWAQVTADDIEPMQISGAMTNIIFRVHNTVTGQFVLCRIFGSSEALFSREAEQSIFRQVAEAGLGPKLLAPAFLQACFANGRIEEFLQDQSISATDMRTAPIAYCVAHAMAAFHFSPLIRLHKGTPPTAIVWPRLRAWAAGAGKHFSAEEVAALGLSDVLQEIEALEAALTQRHSSVLGFCHNDLQYGNMLLHTASYRSLSFDLSVPRGCSVERAVRGGSPPPRRGASPDGMRCLRGTSPDPDGVTPWSLERQRAVKGFAPDELEPRTSDGELVADLLASAGEQFRESGRRSASGSGSASPSASLGSSAHSLPQQPGGVRGRSLGLPRLSVRLIDYEYSGPNPVAYDIANYWCEWGADYHTDTPHLLDYSLMPDTQQQENFVRSYLEAAVAHQPHGSHLARDAGEAALEEATRQLVAAANAYVPVSHLLWGLWGLIQARVSDVPDFDFMMYAEQRLEQYFALRHVALGSECT